MNYQIQLERLHDQFLQVTTASLARAAMLQGAFIVMAAAKEGVLPNLDPLEELENEIRTTKKGFGYVAEIQEYYFAWYAKEVTKNEAFKRMEDVHSSLFARMYAAFCLELIDMLAAEPPASNKPVDIVEILLARFHAIWKGRKSHDHQWVANSMDSSTTHDEWEQYRVAKRIKSSTTIVDHFKKLSASWTSDPSRIPPNLK